MSIEITPDEVGIATRVADKILARHRGIVDRDDVVSEVTVWMLEHEEQVLALRERGRGLHTTLYREGMRYLNKERAAVYGYDPSDLARYPLGLVQELLLEALSTDWAAPSGLRDPGGSSGQDPAHSGGRVAMLIDVRAALKGLPPLHQGRMVDAVDLRFDETALAERWSTPERPVTPEGAIRRVRYGLRKMVDSLMELRADREYTGARRVVSNATARAYLGRHGSPRPQRSLWHEGGVLT